MSETKRPGGLTTLAVLNFVFGGKDCLNTLGLVAMIVIKSGAIRLPDQKGIDEFAKVIAELPINVIYGMTAFHVVSAFLLIASGVGYLKQSKVWGRVLGSAGGLVWMGGALALAAVSADAPGGGFTLLTLAMLVYPVLTLVLLNTTFRGDFVRDRAP
jgi:hypothetical protein